MQHSNICDELWPLLKTTHTHTKKVPPKQPPATASAVIWPGSQKATDLQQENAARGQRFESFSGNPASMGASHTQPL